MGRGRSDEWWRGPVGSGLGPVLQTARTAQTLPLPCTRRRRVMPRWIALQSKSSISPAPGIPSAASPGMGPGQAISPYLPSFVLLLHTLPMVVSSAGFCPAAASVKPESCLWTGLAPGDRGLMFRRSGKGKGRLSFFLKSGIEFPHNLLPNAK
ncbi:unnamed protein product [Gadus morhua 'NCC']